jgi:hypothetical protein
MGKPAKHRRPNMKQKNRSLRRSIRRATVVATVLVALTLSACGPETLVVGLESTPTPTPLPTPVVQHYTNEEYGFTFRYPETWSVAEEAQLVQLSQDVLTLNIAYGWASSPGFSPMGGRTGMPAGDLIYGDRIRFLGQVIPAQVLQYERKDKAVFYGETGLVTVDDLVFSIWLEDVGSLAYDELDITKDVQAEAKEILESFERVDATGEPPEPTLTRTPIVEKDLTTYVNEDYGLALIYPPTWELEEIPAGEQAPNSATAVHLTWDALRLTIQFKYVGEETVLGPGSRPAGEIEESGSVTVMGRQIAKQALVYQGKVKSVFLGDRFDDLELYVQLDGGVGTETDYEAIEITESAQSEMEAILGGMTRTGEGKPMPPQINVLTYENADDGFSFQYPTTWALEEVAGATMEDGVKIADAVILVQDTFNLIVQYQRKSDPTPVAWGGGLLPADMGYQESVLSDPVTVVGVETHERIWTYDEGVKAVLVDVVNPTSDLVFQISLTDGSARSIKDAGAKTIPDAAMAALDQALASLTVWPRSQ